MAGAGQMTRLLFVVTEDWYFCSHRLPLAEAAIREGMAVTVVTRVSDKKALMESSGIKIIPIDIARSGTNPFQEAATVFQLFKIFRKEKPDIVHLVAMKPVILGGVAALLAGVRNSVSAIAGMGFMFTSKERMGIIRHAVTSLLVFLSTRTRIIVQNPEDAEFLEKAGVKPERITLIRGSGVNLELFHPQPEPEGIPVIMLAARLLWDKGVGEFVKAASLLQQKGIEARFVLVGEPDHCNPASVPLSEIEYWVRKGIVEWWGKSYNMHRILPLANIVCLPSYREGLPKILLEAMACGRACVTTDAPGCRDAVQDGVNGLLVPIRNHKRLAEALAKLIAEPELRRTMGRAGRSIAEKHFSQEQVISETMSVYQELLSC